MDVYWFIRFGLLGQFVVECCEFDVFLCCGDNMKYVVLICVGVELDDCLMDEVGLFYCCGFQFNDLFKQLCGDGFIEMQ